MNQHGDIIRTYAQLDWWCSTFFGENGPSFLIIIGKPGLSKSKTFEMASPEGTLVLSGALSAFHLYIQLYHHRDRPVVIDDVDALFKDKASVNLLKSLGQTDKIRTVYWGKQAKQLDDEGVPRRFQTSSRVCILANTMARIEENLAAVMDRAFVLNFQPTVAEVHRKVGTWFGDREVYEYAGQHLRLVTQPSMRPYAKAAELKRMGGDWRSWLLNQWAGDDPQLILIAKILHDPDLTTAAQRVERFQQLCGGSRATFMRHQSRYREITAPIAAPDANAA